MKYLLKLNEYIQSSVVKPKMDRVLSTPMSAEMFLKKIANRFNDLISKQTSESLEDNPGMEDDFLRKLRGQFEPENLEGAMQDNTAILALLASIRETESEMSEQDKKDKAMEIVEDIFKGKGFDLRKLEFKLDILNDQDLMDAKSDIIGISPEEFKEVKREITRDKPKLKKEIDIRAIQNALTQGFASSIKDDFVMGDTEVEGVSFGDYYSLMDKTFKLYSKIPKEYMHQVMTESPALGRVELKWDEDKKKYVIEAKGYTILILVHEMVKGILELISLHRDPELDAEDEEKMMSLSGTQYMERDGLQYGPGMVNSFKEFFNQVEDNLIEQREIREKNPAMILNVLSRFYQMEDDLFLRACKAIFSDTPDKPYELFEEFYLDGMSGRGFDRRNEPGDDDDPSGLDDDVLRDLLGGAGINLNLDPYNESNKYTLNFDLYSLLEGKREVALKWIQDGANTEKVVRAIDIFSRFTSNWKNNKSLQKVISDVPGLPDDWKIEDKVNIEKYINNYPAFKKIVKRMESYFDLPKVSTIKPGEINMALIPIKDALDVDDDPGFYSKATEEAVKKFQREFSEEQIVPDEVDYREVLKKVKEGGTKLLSTVEKMFLAKSAKFITSVERLIRRKTGDVNNRIQDLVALRSRIDTAEDDERNRLESEYTKLSKDISRIEDTISSVSQELKGVKSIFSGGIEKQSGVIDIPTITALQHKYRDLDLSSIYSNGTLAPNKGKVVYETDSIKVWRITDHGFCMQATDGFYQLMKNSGIGQDMKETYGWCISWKDPGQYKSHRHNQSRYEQTIYFIENTKRANYEADMIKEFLDSGGSFSNRAEYLVWRNNRLQGANLEEDQLREKSNASSHRINFWDAYHVSVVFVNNKANPNDPDEEYSYWCVDANNSVEWGNNESTSRNALTFEQIASAIWPSQPGGLPVARNASGANVIRVPKDVIDQDWYKIPNQSEIEAMKAAIVPTPLSKSEKAMGGNSIRGATNDPRIDVNSFKDLSYREKGEWIANNALGERQTALLNDRSNMDKLIRKDIWKELPDKLKGEYLMATKAPHLPKEYMDEIKNNARLIKLYKSLLQSRLLTDNNRENMLHNMDIEVVLNSPNPLTKIISQRLTPDELKLISDEKTVEMKKDLVEMKKELIELEKKEYSAKNARRKKSIKDQITKLERIIGSDSLALKYRDTIKKIKDRDYSDLLNRKMIDEKSGKLKYDELIRSLIQAGLADSAISGQDKMSIGEKKIFADSIASIDGIDSLNIDHSEVPYLDEIILGDGKSFTEYYKKYLENMKTEENPTKRRQWELRKNYFNHIAERYLSSLLLGGEDVDQLVKNNGTINRNFNSERHVNQIKEVVSYIMKMNPEFKNWIDFIARNMWYHYGLNSIKTTDSPTNERNFINSITKPINDLIDKFPFLERRGSPVKKIRTVNRDIEKGSTGNIIRTRHTEDLG